MTEDFSRLMVSDGQIGEVVLVGDEVRLALNDWQERKVVVTFEGVVGVEAVGATGVDLGHAGQSADDPFIQKS